MDYNKFAKMCIEWRGDVCLIGAGKCGSTWGYDIVKRSGFRIRCYLDNYKFGGSCNGYPVYSLDYLKANQDLLCFVTIIGEEKDNVVHQIKDIGINNYICMTEKEVFQIEFAQFLDELGDKDLIDKFDWLMDDKQYLINRFKERMGYEPNLDNPKTFNEKLNWLKIHARNPLYSTMVDKYAVKQYIGDKIGYKYVIPILGIWDSFDEINFDILPERFVLKCTHDSGSIVICTDKYRFDMGSAKKILENGRKHNYFWPDREWPYYSVPRRILAEELIGDGKQSLNVYKIFNFNGVPRIVQVIQDDKTEAESIDYFDTKWNLLELRQNFPNSVVHLERPRRLGELLELAAILSEGFPFLRTDFYVVENRVLFSEFTFFTDSGSERFYPDEWDAKLGDLIIL